MDTYTELCSKFYLRIVFAPDYRTNIRLVYIYNMMLNTMCVVLIHLHLLVIDVLVHPKYFQITIFQRNGSRIDFIQQSVYMLDVPSQITQLLPQSLVYLFSDLVFLLGD